jgi:energy-coupling factor transporter ATP-binding protein EcfA2
VDFYQIKERSAKNGVVEIYPDFKVCRSKDLMVRGKSFYGIWDEAKGLWSTDEYDVQRLVDAELLAHKEKVMQRTDGTVLVKLMADFSTKSWVEFRKYLGNISDSAHQLDEKLTFLNTEVKKKDYVSKRLNYPLEEGKYDAFDEIIGTLYEPEQRAKLEWAIGAIISGDAKDIQKFIVLYGEAGAGKSTILNIIQKLFEGYYTAFEAKALTSSSNAFATEAFKANPLVAIQHDGDLSRIEDNTKLNSIVSHEEMTMNEKYKPSYMARVNCFLFMGTNKPVKITDAKSGIIRRLIDVKPSGKKIPAKRYQALMAQIDFELGAIAWHCLEVYREMGKNYYNSYRPLEMMLQTDVFFNFIESNYYTFKEQDGVSLKQAYEMYKTYCDEALVEFKSPRHKFREELKNYFSTFSDIARIDGAQVRSYYSGFLFEKFSNAPKAKEEHQSSLVLDCTESLLDVMCADCPAQYAETTKAGVVKPILGWNYVKTKLSEINTQEVHYLKMFNENHIVVDFDLKDETGEKSMEKNIEAASKWPATYAEFSKSGAGVHLHYIYDGDVKKLSRVYSEGIEIKVFTGNSSLRRKLTKCNNIPIATINSGLPLKGETMINFEAVKSEKGLRELIKRNLNKEIHAGTKPSIDFINKILEDAYNSGLSYDVTDMRPAVLAFANNSSHQADYCIKLVSQMKFKSEAPSVSVENYDGDELVFFDVEVFPNLFVVVWKPKGKPSVKMINPSPADIGPLLERKLVGFNCRRYDNHIMYARYIGYNNEQLYNLSQRIINGSSNAMFGEAYGLSYTDVYDFASAANKKSLKKFEIELGIHHQELGLPWDQPVPEDMWDKVADYCINDVVATEATFDHLSADWIARQILAELSGLTVNDTTNQHTIRIVFGDNKHPQDQLVYTHLDEMFPGYKYENGKSTYRGETVGEGGYVYAEPGMYINVALLDVASMHPTSTEELNLLGPYTKNYSDLKRARVAIKHEDYEALKTLMDGKLVPFIKKVEEGLYTLKDLSTALKTPINSAYGLTSAKFDNPFRDPRNIDNIVAKRGALFMIDLKNAVQEQGFKVAHIKTDSIKIPDANQYIINFVMEFGKKYGYDFEHEATYDKMCLVNDAVYIAKYKDGKHAGEWTATGAQFAQPYVFKTLFSKEKIEFADLCETKSVSTNLYLDMNENLPDVSKYEKELELFIKKNPGLDIPTPHLLNEISKGHDYHFVGKVGSFCPIKPNRGGGVLLREKDGKYYAATGSKGYRWLEAEMVKVLKKEDDIDTNYYRGLVDDALDNMKKYGDVEWFISDNPTDTPPWMMPCGLYESCMECPNWTKNEGKINSCKLGYDCMPF